MSIILGILSLIAVIIASVAVTFLTGFELLHLSVFLIMPLGSLFIGYWGGYGYFKGLVLSNKYIAFKHFFVGFILSLLCIAAIKYTTYYFTCIDPENNTIIYSYNGDHISNYEAVGYGKLDFLNYNKYMIENTPISFVIKSLDFAEISHPMIGWLSVFIDFLGVISGFILAGLIQRKNPYCHDCKLYKKKKKLFIISKTEKDNFFNQLNDLTSQGKWETAYSMLSKYAFDKNVKNQEHLLCKLSYCKNCNISELNFELYELSYLKRIKKNPYYEHPITIDYKLTEKLLNKEKAALDTDKNTEFDEKFIDKVNESIKVSEEAKIHEKVKVEEKLETEEEIKL